jgi:hypothetical protein
VHASFPIAFWVTRAARMQRVRTYSVTSVSELVGPGASVWLSSTITMGDAHLLATAVVPVYKLVVGRALRARAGACEGGLARTDALTLGPHVTHMRDSSESRI